MAENETAKKGGAGGLRDWLTVANFMLAGAFVGGAAVVVKFYTDKAERSDLKELSDTVNKMQQDMISLQKDMAGAINVSDLARGAHDKLFERLFGRRQTSGPLALDGYILAPEAAVPMPPLAPADRTKQTEGKKP